MESKVAEGGEAGGEMRRRRITLDDGRYLIYYTFGDEGGEARAAGGAAPVGGAPEAEPEAGEERGV